MARLRDFETKNSLRGFRAVLFRMVSKRNVIKRRFKARFRAVLFRMVSKLQPKAQYFDDLVERNLLTNFRDTAKMLKVKEREFIGWLLDKKYIYRDKKNKLVPTANKNDGLFEIKETKNESTAWKGTQTLITPKGRETFNILFNN